MSYTIKPYEELDIMDDFLANAVAGDVEVGEEFARALIKGLLQLDPGRIQVNIQRVILASTPVQRGIRLDIEISEFEENNSTRTERTIYNIEPQKRKDIHLIKHNRFYQAKIDSQKLKSGERNFISLPNLFVITITDYDPFGYDYMLYTVHNRCDEVPDLEYDDGLVFLYFNTKGTLGGSSDLKNVLNYLQDSRIENVTNEITKRLHDCVSRVKVSPEMRMEYMLWEEKIFYEKLDARDEGLEEGLRKGLEKGLMKGRREGTLQTLYGLIHDGLLTIEEAAKRADMTIEDFCRELH